MGVNGVQGLDQRPADNLFKRTLEVTVDVVWMILVLHKRVIDKNLGNANGPKLADQNRKLIDQPPPPFGVPSRRPVWWSGHEKGLTEFVQRGQMVTFR